MTPQFMGKEHMSKPSYSIKRLDHLGIIAGVIKDLGLVELINQRLGTYDDETLSAGEVVAGMIINGLGFSQKPLSLTPLFFQQRPLELLFREGVQADDFNRFKLGRILDRCHRYGTESLFTEVAQVVCDHEKIDRRFNSLDTTSFNLSGEYLADSDEQTVEIKHGYSKDHRPDLKQVMLEVMVSHDGGVPMLGKVLNGNAADTTIFKERSQQLIEQFKQSEAPRYLIADCKLYTQDNGKNLAEHAFITRIPQRIKDVNEVIEKALADSAPWVDLDEASRMKTFKLTHYGMDQRWHVISSTTSRHNAIKQIEKKVEKESTVIEKQMYHFQAQRFSCSSDGVKAAEKLAKQWKYHQLGSMSVTEHKQFAGKGRPKKDQEPTAYQYQISLEKIEDSDRINHLKAVNGHYIIGGNIPTSELTDEEIVAAYKQQHKVEKGFRFLKDPLFFTSSLFVNKPERVMALLMVMLFSLLVYSIAERRMRACLLSINATLPNQIGVETNTPTLRWAFQLLEGINCLNITLNDQQTTVIEGINAQHEKIIRLFGKMTCSIYQISENEGCSM